MKERRLKELYAQVLELSKEAVDSTRLDAPQATVTMVSPLCGSQITVDLCLEGDRVSGFGQKVRACTLGAAAASIVGANVVGRSADELRTLRETMRRMLKEGGPPPEAPWQQLALLEGARELTARHGSIMLAFDALTEALDEIQGGGHDARKAPAKGIPDTMRA